MLVINMLVAQLLHNKEDTSYIDYRKDFDSVREQCPNQKHIIINNDKLLETFTIKVNLRRGIFQGETVSAVWFCIAINPQYSTT